MELTVDNPFIEPVVDNRSVEELKPTSTQVKPLKKPDKISSLKLDDVVLVKFPTKKQQLRFFLCKMMKILANKKFENSYVRKRVTNKSTIFIYPDVEDVHARKIYQIVKKVSGYCTG